MVKRGKCTSLLTCGKGSPKLEVAIKKRTCKGCNGDITAGTKCIEISVAGSFTNHKSYCFPCFKDILVQTKKDIESIEGEMI